MRENKENKPQHARKSRRQHRPPSARSTQPTAPRPHNAHRAHPTTRCRHDTAHAHGAFKPPPRHPPSAPPPTAPPPPSVPFAGLSTSSQQKPAGNLQATSTSCVPLLPILLKHGLVIHVLVFPALLLQPLDQRVLLGNFGTASALTCNARCRRDSRSVWTPPHKSSPRRGARQGEEQCSGAK